MLNLKTYRHPGEYSRARCPVKPAGASRSVQSEQDAKLGLAALFAQTLRTRLAACGYGVDVFDYPVHVTYRRHRRVMGAVST